MEPFSNNFDLKNWFNRIKDHSYFGVGLATIYLNRIDRKSYSIFNDKTINALNKLDYNISTSKNYSNYLKVNAIQKEWIKLEPTINNLEKADALCHFVIGETEGINLINRLKLKDSSEANNEQDELLNIIDKNIKDDDLLELIRRNERCKQEYISINSKRFKRSNYLMTLIKKRRGFKCQFCNTTILKEDGKYYIEACHINAKANGGADELENILVLCPNHHKLFDFGNKTIIKHDNNEFIAIINGVKCQAKFI